MIPHSGRPIDRKRVSALVWPAVTRSGRLSRAIYVERATMGNAVMMPLAKKCDDVAPYFAIVLVPGWEHAP